MFHDQSRKRKAARLILLIPLFLVFVSAWLSVRAESSPIQSPVCSFADKGLFWNSQSRIGALAEFTVQNVLNCLFHYKAHVSIVEFINTKPQSI